MTSYDRDTFFAILLSVALLLVAVAAYVMVPDTRLSPGARRYGASTGTPRNKRRVQLERRAVIVVGAVVQTVPLVLFVRAGLARRLRRRTGKPYCRECGYNLMGNVSGTCPECGTRLRAYQVGEYEREAHDGDQGIGTASKGRESMPEVHGPTGHR